MLDLYLRKTRSGKSHDHILGGYRVFEKGIRERGHRRRHPIGGPGVILPRKISSIENLGYGPISRNLRPGGSIEPLLDPPRLYTKLTSAAEPDEDPSAILV